jgi:hypothetical protein
MELITGRSGTNHIHSEDVRAFNAGLFGAGNYIIQGGSNLAATAVSANSVQIADGEAFIQGSHCRIRRGETETVAISNGGQGVGRHDLIVIRYEMAADGVETATFRVVEGTPSDTPEDPTVQTGDILAGDIAAEVPLYRVRIEGISIAGIDRLLPVSDRGMQLTLAAANFTAGTVEAFTSVPLMDGQGFYGTDVAGVDTELAYTGTNGRYKLSGVTEGMAIWVGEE